MSTEREKQEAAYLKIYEDTRKKLMQSMRIPAKLYLVSTPMTTHNALLAAHHHMDRLGLARDPK